MKTQSDHDRAIDVVREIVHRWDPYGLLAIGCPPGEFDSEIASVAAQVPRIRSRSDAAHALSRVFSSTFSAERFRPENCAGVGAELFEALKSAGLLSG